MTNTKEEKYARVAQALGEIIGQKGLSGVTVSWVARKAGVSRPWLYKYLGKDRETLIEFFVDHFGRVFSTVDVLGEKVDREAWVQNRIQGTRRFLEDSVRYPWAMLLYFQHANQEGPLGERIRIWQNSYLKSFARELQMVTDWDSKKALFFAETYTAFRTGLMHRWLSKKFRDSYTEEEILATVEKYLRSLM